MNRKKYFKKEMGFPLKIILWALLFLIILSYAVLILHLVIVTGPIKIITEFLYPVVKIFIQSVIILIYFLFFIVYLAIANALEPGSVRALIWWLVLCSYVTVIPMGLFYLLSNL